LATMSEAYKAYTWRDKQFCALRSCTASFSIRECCLTNSDHNQSEYSHVKTQHEETPLFNYLKYHNTEMCPSHACVFKTLSTPICRHTHIELRIGSFDIRAEDHVRLLAECPLLLSDFNVNRHASKNFLELSYLLVILNRIFEDGREDRNT
jgi:hypothetical protein